MSVFFRLLLAPDVFAGKDVLGQALSTEGWDVKELTGRLTTSPATLAIGRVTIGFVGGLPLLMEPVEATLL